MNKKLLYALKILAVLAIIVAEILVIVIFFKEIVIGFFCIQFFKLCGKFADKMFP